MEDGSGVTGIIISKDVFQKLQSLSETDKGLYLSFLSRMIYSCLVDADFLDTEQFMSNGEIVRNGGIAWWIFYIL